MFTKNVRKDRMRALVRKTIRKPKFWQEFLKWLAICVAASLLVSYFYLEKRREAAKVARRVEFIETAAEPDFQKKFMDAIAIPHAKDKFPHIE